MLVAACLIVVTSASWLRWNMRYEGRILLTLSANHGVTLGDLAILPAVGVGLGLLVRLRRSSRPLAQSPSNDR